MKEDATTFPSSNVIYGHGYWTYHVNHYGACNYQSHFKQEQLLKEAWKNTTKLKIKPKQEQLKRSEINVQALKFKHSIKPRVKNNQYNSFLGVKPREKKTQPRFLN